MEGTAYDVRWVGGEPIIVQDSSCKRLLSTEDEHFILQQARAKKRASQPNKPAASAQPSGSIKPSQQATKGAARHCDTPHNLWCWPGVSLYTMSLWMSRLSLGDLQAEMRCCVGAHGMPAKGAANLSDDDASSCPSLETDDDLIEPYSGPAHPPPSPAYSPTRGPGSSRRNARVEEVDAAVDDDSNSDVDGKCSSWLPLLRAMAKHPSNARKKICFDQCSSFSIPEDSAHAASAQVHHAGQLTEHVNCFSCFCKKTLPSACRWGADQYSSVSQPSATAPRGPAAGPAGPG